ncbi:MAG: hypothetical protein WKF36_04995 [Candidatus Nitrosocosmicus sp.]
MPVAPNATLTDESAAQPMGTQPQLRRRRATDGDAASSSKCDIN